MKKIEINQELCIGCGICAESCHMAAIGLKDGKAYLMKENECDGIGNCLPTCPVDAIKLIEKKGSLKDNYLNNEYLNNWPIQLNLVSPSSFENHENILICADCVPFAYKNFHEDFLNDHVVVMGCPKLDDNQKYVSKIYDILSTSKKNVKVLKMEVPCCNGIANMTLKANEALDNINNVEVITIGINGCLKN